MAWAEDFAPKSLKEFAGNPSAVGELEKWGGSPPLLLVGPPGSGKTSAALALAKDRGWECFELNASDLRSKKAVEKIAGAASSSATFSGKKRLVLFDEVDGLFRADYGGAGAVLSILRTSKNPVVLTANDEYAKTLSSIRKECHTVKFKKVHHATIAHALEKICAEKGVGPGPGALEAIAKASRGDLKAAINDLQALATGKKSLTEPFPLSARDREESIFNAMRALFKATSFNAAREAFDSVQEDPDLFMKWVGENIPREYTRAEDLANAFKALSRADFYNACIYRRQQWQLMKFQIDMMTGGVAMAKQEPYHGFTPYQFPSFIRKLSASRARRAAKSSAAKKIGAAIHSSPREVVSEHWPYFQLLAKKQPQGYAKAFGLDEKELEALGVPKAAAKKAQDL